KSRHFLQAHRWSVAAVAPVPGGSTFVSGGQDGILRLHDWRTGKEVRRFGSAGDEKPQFIDLRVSGDGKTVISQKITAKESGEAPFHSWDLATGKLLRSFPRQGSADFSHLTTDGKHVISVHYSTFIGESGKVQQGRDATVEVREVAGGRPVFRTGETDSWGME